jgi:hypothetical protein
VVRAKLDVYYTFKIVSGAGEQLKVHCLKWEEFSDVPLTTYTILPENHSPTGGCDCPAWTSQCKHRRCVDEALKDGKAQEFHKWRWYEKGGWVETQDISSIEDMPEIG